VATPDAVDDPSLPLGASWKKQVDRFLARNRPEYGAFVAIETDTGRLVTVSEWSSGGQVPHPATTAAFPAASVFKMVTASALLESGVRPGTSVCYHGGMHALDESNIKDSKADRACQSLSGAFAHSTNAVFGKLAVRHLDGDRLVRQAERLGFNRALTVGDLRTESRVSRPTGALAIARMAAGFVNSTLSPLHAAVMAAIVATGRVPSGVSMEGAAGATVLDARVVGELREMMTRTSSEGTAAKYLATLAGRAGGPIAVKTGTLVSRDGSGLLNTWMVGYFPANHPEVAFAALISTKGGGPVKAGHLARYSIDAYLKLKHARAGRS
jgi:cell division protein FtsI/penicillin-binding protein 2